MKTRIMKGHPDDRQRPDRYAFNPELPYDPTDLTVHELQDRHDRAERLELLVERKLAGLNLAYPIGLSATLALFAIVINAPVPTWAWVLNAVLIGCMLVLLAWTLRERTLATAELRAATDKRYRYKLQLNARAQRDAQNR